MGTKADLAVWDLLVPGSSSNFEEGRIANRTREPVEVVGELVDWTGHSPEQVRAMRDGLASLKRRGLAVIYD